MNAAHELARLSQFDLNLFVAGSDLLLTMPRRHAAALNTPLGNHLLPMPVALPPKE